jgi:hypothetical protein
VNEDDVVHELRRGWNEVAKALDHAIIQVKGAAELRNALEHMLRGTPYEKPTGYDHEGLYGRLQSAVRKATQNEKGGK